MVQLLIRQACKHQEFRRHTETRRSMPGNVTKNPKLFETGGQPMATCWVRLLAGFDVHPFITDPEP